MAPLPNDRTAAAAASRATIENPQLEIKSYAFASFNPTSECSLPIQAASSRNSRSARSEWESIYDLQEDSDDGIFESISNKRKHVPEIVHTEFSKSTTSQMVAPSESLKRRTGRGTTLYTNTQGKHISPFQNTIITKYSKPISNAYGQNLSTQPVIQHKQIVTTEHQLYLSSSTLEKLDAFRYKAETYNQAVEYEDMATEEISREDLPPVVHDSESPLTSHIPLYSFDDGICDSDLLGVGVQQEPASTLPERMCSSYSSESHTIEAPQVSHRNIHHGDFSLLAPDGSRDITTRSGLSTVEAALSDSDKGYSMDEEEEEELLHLTHTAECNDACMVSEKFIPSTSVEGAFCAGSDDIEVYDSTLQFSSPKLPTHPASPKAINGSNANMYNGSPLKETVTLDSLTSVDEEDWCFMRPHLLTQSSPKTAKSSPQCQLPLINNTWDKGIGHVVIQTNFSSSKSLVDDQHEYEEVKPFARPPFPKLIPERSPVVGLSSGSILRVCFRIGEIYREGARCSSLDTDAVIELFARVGFSSREPGTVKQHFQFLDLWHDRPPIVTGILPNYKTTPLAESECKVFIDERGKMARCLGRLKRDARKPTGWVLHIINIRETDWEEIRWTKRIISGDCSAADNDTSSPEDV